METTLKNKAVTSYFFNYIPKKYSAKAYLFYICCMQKHIAK